MLAKLNLITIASTNLAAAEAKIVELENKIQSILERLDTLETNE